MFFYFFVCPISTRHDESMCDVSDVSGFAFRRLGMIVFLDGFDWDSSEKS